MEYQEYLNQKNINYIRDNINLAGVNEAVLLDIVSLSTAYSEDAKPQLRDVLNFGTVKRVIAALRYALQELRAERERGVFATTYEIDGEEVVVLGVGNCTNKELEDGYQKIQLIQTENEEAAKAYLNENFEAFDMRPPVDYDCTGAPIATKGRLTCINEAYGLYAIVQTVSFDV